MAVTHISYNSSTQHGTLLHAALKGLEDGLDLLNDTLSSMSRMIDGDGSQDAHYAYMRDKFGFPTEAEAHAAFNELNSAAFKLNTNASVTDMNAALLQVFSKFR